MHDAIGSFAMGGMWLWWLLAIGLVAVAAYAIVGRPSTKGGRDVDAASIDTDRGSHRQE